MGKMSSDGYSPNLSNEIVNGVPGESAESDAAPPAHAVRGKDICVCMKMVCNRDLAISERSSDEANAEVLVLVETTKRRLQR